MSRKRWWVWIGAGLSLVLVVVLLWRLDWPSFLKALQALRPAWAIGTTACLVLGIAVRALRWNVLADAPLERYWHFWRSASLGYFGNLIYPARAGELLRMAAISRFAQVPAGAAVTSAVVDRIADFLLLGLVLLAVVLQGTRVPGLAALTTMAGLAGALAISFILWGDRLEARLVRRLARAPVSSRVRGLRWYNQGMAVMRALRRPGSILSVGLLTLTAFGLDFLCYWLLLSAFGWPLPLMAAVTVGAFVAAGSSLPSAPGYIGIYQVACILALQLYGVAESQALAYSVVFQLLVFLVVGMQGAAAMISYSLRLSELPSTPAPGVS